MVDEKEDRHSDRQSVGDLFEDGGVFSVGDVAGDFDAAVDRTRVHDEDIFLGTGDSLAIESEQSGIFFDGGEDVGGDSFPLDPEHVDDIDVGEDVVEVVADFDAQVSHAFGQEGGGSDEDDFGAEFGESPDIASCDPTMGDVSDDGYFESIDFSFDFSNGEHIQQGLGGVFMAAVAGVDDGGIDALCEVVGGAGCGMSDDDDVDAHGFDIFCGVDEGFAFGDAGDFCGEFDDVGTESTGGE